MACVERKFDGKSEREKGSNQMNRKRRERMAEYCHHLTAASQQSLSPRRLQLQSRWTPDWEDRVWLKKNKKKNENKNNFSVQNGLFAVLTVGNITKCHSAN